MIIMDSYKLINKIKNINFIDFLIRRNPIYYSYSIKLLNQLINYNYEERIKWTERQLKNIICVAQKNFKHLEKQEFCKWPITDKDIINSNYFQFINRNFQIPIIAYTSGSTGKPLKLYRSLKSVVFEQACLDLICRLQGLNPYKLKIAILRGNEVKPPDDNSLPYWKFVSGKKLVLSSYHLSFENIKHYYEILLKFAPDCLMAYPSSLEMLCKYLQQSKYILNIPLIITSSEVLPDNVRDLAQKVLGCKVIDLYGQAERVALAYSVKNNEYYFIPGYSYVELGYHSSDDEADFYEVIGTSLWNTKMFFIRYKTGDLIKVNKGTDKKQIDKIRYGLSPFKGIVGRKNDYILSPDGIRIIAINNLFWNVDNVIRAQVIQDAIDKIRILVIPAIGFNENNKKQIMVNARYKIPQNISIKIQIVNKLEVNKQGKVPFIIRGPEVQEFEKAKK
ncbi:phenylacetate--CoA ligase family protein [Carboxydocella sp. ULO1]|uniref:phenylacetate--CoA ligase family protein n=1 Tax=Carboxydocella sp. ULO1 TaxID=1926599 RepID=UPI0009AE8878|nr:phenylacetate--CoA ligase family protein [Carboxydocella sp. ULO1]